MLEKFTWHFTQFWYFDRIWLWDGLYQNVVQRLVIGFPGAPHIYYIDYIYWYMLIIQTIDNYLLMDVNRQLHALQDFLTYIYRYRTFMWISINTGWIFEKKKKFCLVCNCHNLKSQPFRKYRCICLATSYLWYVQPLYKSR